MTTMTDQRPADDFIRAAVERGIREWRIRECSICGYKLGYIIEGEGLFYDAGCHCSGRSVLEARTWDDLAAHYNRNQPSRNDRAAGTPWLAEMRAFWGFDG